MKVLVTEYGNNYKEIADVTLPVMLEYARKHGYVISVIELGDEGFPYKKIEHFKKLMSDRDVELIAYLDIDILITNFKFRFEDFMDDDHDLFITKDINEINGGSLILRNTEEGRWMVDKILSIRDEFENEQNAINYLIDNITFSLFTKILPHPSINSYLTNLYPEYSNIYDKPEHWGSGDFILHLPAIPIKQRIEILKSTPILK